MDLTGRNGQRDHFLQPQIVVDDHVTEWLANNVPEREFDLDKQSHPESWAKGSCDLEPLAHVQSASTSSIRMSSSNEALTPSSDSSYDTRSETSTQSTWQSSVTSSTDGSSEEEDYDGFHPLRTVARPESLHDKFYYQAEVQQCIDTADAVNLKSNINSNADNNLKLPRNHRFQSQGSQHQQSYQDQSIAVTQYPGTHKLNRRRSGQPENSTAPPCKLRRDTDTSDRFVTLLIIFATRLITAIWPLSACPPMTSTSFNNGAGVLPLRVFIQETLRRSKTSYSTLQVALYYLILLKSKLPDCDFTQEQPGLCPSEEGHAAGKPPCRAMQCGRRMFLAALMLASKYLQDRNYSTRAWSKISGLRTVEINENEMQYLRSIDYNLHISKESFENWSKLVLTLCKMSKAQPKGVPLESMFDLTELDQKDGFSIDENALLEERLYSDQWWTKLLSQIHPEMIRGAAKTDSFLLHLPAHESNEALARSDHPMPNVASAPRCPQGYRPDMNFSDAFPSRASNPKVSTLQPHQHAATPVQPTSLPHRPQLRNLPTPQSTPRVPEVCPWSANPGNSTLRCAASMDALRSVRKQCFMSANLERCPPPVRPSSSFFLTPVHNLVRPAESNLDILSRSTTPSVSSPLSVITESACYRSRSRSSSVSSSASWPSLPSDRRRVLQGLQEIPSSSPLTNVTSIAPMNLEAFTQHDSALNNSLSQAVAPRDEMVQVALTLPRDGKRSGADSMVQATEKLPRTHNEAEAIQALMSLSSFAESPDRHQTSMRKKFGVNPSSHRLSFGNCHTIGHKRSYSRTKDALQVNVREALLLDNSTDAAMPDSMPCSHERVRAKQLQLPTKRWAAAKKPVSNYTDNKRIAILCLHEYNSAPDLASQYVKEQMISV